MMVFVAFLVGDDHLYDQQLRLPKFDLIISLTLWAHELSCQLGVG